MTTRSDYNNNPGNLRPPKGLTYEGQIGIDEKGFAVFENREFGRKALLQDIRVKLRRGLNTPESFINRYSPAGVDEYGDENSQEGTDNYKMTLASGLGLASTNDPFPEGSEEKIADLITRFEGTSQPPPTPGAGAEPPIPEGEEEEPSLKERFKEQLPGIAGAGVGTAVGTTLTAGKKAKQGMELFADYLRSQVGAKPMQIPNVTAPPGMGFLGAAPVAPLSAIPSDGPDAGRLARGQTGTMPYNYAKAAGLTDIEAGRALDMTKQAGGVHDLTTQRREAMQRIQQLFPGERYVENPRFGGLMTLDQGVGGGPRQSFVQQGPVPSGAPPGAVPPQGTLTPLPPRVPVSTTPPAPSLLDDAIAKLSNIAKGGLRLLSSAPVAGGLGGYGAAMSGVEAYEREQAGDRLGAVLSGLGGLSALAAVPYPPAQAVGLAAGVLSPLSLMALERMRKIRAEPAPAPATAAEMEMARQPAFRYARP